MSSEPDPGCHALLVTITQSKDLLISTPCDTNVGLILQHWLHGPPHEPLLFIVLPWQRFLEVKSIQRSYCDWLNNSCYTFSCFWNSHCNSVSLHGNRRNVAMVTELLICPFSHSQKWMECTEAVHYRDKMNVCLCVRFIESDNRLIKVMR